jgi:hypothetical protein
MVAKRPEYNASNRAMVQGASPAPATAEIVSGSLERRADMVGILLIFSSA